MIKILKERTPVTVVDYRIEFSYKDDPLSGFSFPATRDGEPDFDRMCAEAKVNYERCLTDEQLEEPEFRQEVHKYTEPAVGQCICGNEVVLDSDYIGAVRCECGRWYNIFGQSLVDPEYWED